MNAHRKPHPSRALSFIMDIGSPDGCCWWSVSSTGSYDGDWKKGEELGREYLAYVGDRPTHGDAALLPWIVIAMVERCQKLGTRMTGIELGFLREINRAAMAAASIGVIMGPPAVDAHADALHG